MTSNKIPLTLDELSWAGIPTGNRVRYIWQEWLQKHFERYYGGHLLTVDSLSQSLNLPTNGFDYCVELGQRSSSNLRAKAEQLPIQTDSLTASIFSFSLDYSSDPKALLGEVHRALAPQGYWFGLIYVPNNSWMFHSRLPWTQSKALPRQSIGLARCKDWLQLLGFELLEVQAVVCPWWKGFKQFEQQEESNLTWFSTPVAYMIRAQKKTSTMTPISFNKTLPIGASGKLVNVANASHKVSK